MSSANMSNFLKALDAVKQDYTCTVCHELCKDPVTLSKCFHLICSEHFEGLKTCGACGESLEGCTTYVDDRMGACIDSVKSLDQMVEKYRDKDTSSKAGQSTTQTSETLRLHSDQKLGKAKKVGKSIETKYTLKDQPRKEASKNQSKQAIEKITINEDDFSKANKMNVPVKKSKSRSKNFNQTVLSACSSKINKAHEKRNTKGETYLHVACRLGKVDKAAELLEQGANANTKDNAGWTPLHEAVQNGHLDLVRLLLQHNALVNVPGQGNETPLHEAVRFNQREIAEELIKHGADFNARNCKGETPVQLASSDKKEFLEEATENIIQTQSINITRISEMYTELEYEDIRVYCVSENPIVENKLKLLLKHHSNLHVEAKWSKKVTHLIVDDDHGVCQSSLEVLQGLVAAVWILGSEWIIRSSEENLEPFVNYEITGVGTKTYNGPKNARHNKYKQLPGIFDGCHFYLHNFKAKYEISKKMVLTKVILSKLITEAGGVVLRRAPNPESIPESEKLVPYHAKKDGKLVNCSHYIIFKDLYEPMYNMQHIKALPIGWLIECIEKYEMCEP